MDLSESECINIEDDDNISNFKKNANNFSNNQINKNMNKKNNQLRSNQFVENNELISLDTSETGKIFEKEGNSKGIPIELENIDFNYNINIHKSLENEADQIKGLNIPLSK